MNRKVKLLGIAITAIAAMSALGAAGAQAETAELSCTTTTNNCVITSQSSDHQFNIQGGNVRCNQASFEVTTTKTTSNSTITATYGTCRAFGVSAPINMNGCYYESHGANNGELTSTVDVVCPGGNKITVTAAAVPCTVTVGAQNGLAHATDANSGNSEPTHVTSTVRLIRIQYTLTGVGCGTTGTFNDGTYNGTATLEAYNDTGSRGPPYEMGNKVGLHEVIK